MESARAQRARARAAVSLSVALLAAARAGGRRGMPDAAAAWCADISCRNDLGRRLSSFYQARATRGVVHCWWQAPTCTRGHIRLNRASCEGAEGGCETSCILLLDAGADIDARG